MATTSTESDNYRIYGQDASSDSHPDSSFISETPTTPRRRKSRASIMRPKQGINERVSFHTGIIVALIAVMIAVLLFRQTNSARYLTTGFRHVAAETWKLPSAAIAKTSAAILSTNQKILEVAQKVNDWGAYYKQYTYNVTANALPFLFGKKSKPQRSSLYKRLANEERIRRLASDIVRVELEVFRSLYKIDKPQYHKSQQQQQQPQAAVTVSDAQIASLVDKALANKLQTSSSPFAAAIREVVLDVVTTELKKQQPQKPASNVETVATSSLTIEQVNSLVQKVTADIEAKISDISTDTNKRMNDINAGLSATKQQLAQLKEAQEKAASKEQLEALLSGRLEELKQVLMSQYQVRLEKVENSLSDKASQSEYQKILDDIQQLRSKLMESIPTEVILQRKIDTSVQQSLDAKVMPKVTEDISKRVQEAQRELEEYVNLLLKQKLDASLKAHEERLAENQRESIKRARASRPQSDSTAAPEPITLDAEPYLQEEILELIRREISRYDADRINRTDFAQVGKVAHVSSVFDPITSNIPQTKAIAAPSQPNENDSPSLLSTLQKQIFSAAKWARKHAGAIPNSPDNILKPDLRPGNCWCMEGGNGWIVIDLDTPIYPDSFSIDHLPASIAIDITSAPKNVSVYGIHEGTDKKTEFGHFVYEVGKGVVQTWKIPFVVEEPFKSFELVIGSNYGNPAYTCVYRFRIHGSKTPLSSLDLF